jgi:hypothetical protein
MPRDERRGPRPTPDVALAASRRSNTIRSKIRRFPGIEIGPELARGLRRLKQRRQARLSDKGLFRCILKRKKLLIFR